jgi:hypothetical protein
LRQEVARLKRMLSEAHGGRAVAMTGAERVRKLRAKRKELSHHEGETIEAKTQA